MKKPVRVAVTGAAGQIGYALLFRIAAGEMLGRDQPVILQLLELPIDKAQAALKGVMMELEDCAFPLLAGMAGTGDPEGRVQGRRLRDAGRRASRAGPAWSARTCCSRTRRSSSSRARRSTRSPRATSSVLVVGNPANTNAYIAMKSAPSLPKKNFTAMLRLDHNRALSQLAAKTGKPVGAIEKLMRLGQPLADDVRRLPLRDRRRPVGQGADQRRGLEPQRVPAHGRQARRGDHRGARPVVGRLRRQRGDRPRPRLGARQRRQVGDDGRRRRTAATASRRTSCTACRSPPPAASTRASRAFAIDDFSREKMDATLKELEEERAGVAALLG